MCNPVKKNRSALQLALLFFFYGALNTGTVFLSRIDQDGFIHLKL